MLVVVGDGVVDALVVCELVVGGSLWVSLLLVWVVSLSACCLLSQFARLYMASPQCLGELLMIHTIPWVHGLIHHNRAVVVVDGTYLVMGTRSHPYLERPYIFPSHENKVGCKASGLLQLSPSWVQGLIDLMRTVVIALIMGTRSDGFE